MTDLVVPAWMDPARADTIEHWHAMVMHGGLLASVVVTRAADATWSARTQLRDRSLAPCGDCRTSGPFASSEAALQAGQASAMRLHKAWIGMRVVPPSPGIIATPPPGGYQSQALQRYARTPTDAKTRPMPSVLPQRATEAEVFA